MVEVETQPLAFSFFNAYVIGEHVEEFLRLIHYARKFVQWNSDSATIQFDADAQTGHFVLLLRLLSVRRKALAPGFVQTFDYFTAQAILDRVIIFHDVFHDF